jgi:hypothetical protein
MSWFTDTDLHAAHQSQQVKPAENTNKLLIYKKPLAEKPKAVFFK